MPDQHRSAAPMTDTERAALLEQWYPEANCEYCGMCDICFEVGRDIDEEDQRRQGLG